MILKSLGQSVSSWQSERVLDLAFLRFDLRLDLDFGLDALGGCFFVGLEKPWALRTFACLPSVNTLMLPRLVLNPSGVPFKLFS